jgi:DNA-binding PadR family transcriptional regulator
MHSIQDKTTTNWLKEAHKGYLRVGVLILLSKKPSHGYELMKEIKDRSGGFWHPTPGGVYPILRSLEKSKYIKGQWETQNNRKLKVYTITNSGRVILKTALKKQFELSANINSLFKDFLVEVFNVPPDQFPMHVMPGPFSFLLEEDWANLEKLEAHRNHTKQTIKEMQDHLNVVNKKIERAKAEANKNSV